MLHPQQNRVRQVLDLSGLWQFQLDPEDTGVAGGWPERLPAPRKIAVPGSWNEQFVDTRDYLDAAWWVTQVQVPPAWQGQRVFLWAGSANYAARVWVNGRPAGAHEGGHLPFAQCRQQVDELIARDMNHPSVIMWSVANEPFPVNFGRPVAEDDPAVVTGTAFLGALVERARALDPTRPVTLAALHATPTPWMRLCDVVCINRYYGWYTQSGQLEAGAAALAAELDRLHAALGKPMVITEFGADTIAGHHSLPPEMFSEEYQVEFLRGYLDAAAVRPFVAGLHVWNFADFKTAQGVARPGGLNTKGVFTRDRRPKMAAHFLRQRWGGR